MNQTQAERGAVTKKAHVFQRLVELFEEQHLFTRKDLKRPVVSELLGVNEKYITEAIQEHVGLQFTDFVSVYRVAHAIAQMKQYSGEKSLFEIAEDAGFNSKATFYRAFQDILGVTPAHYYKNIQQYNVSESEIMDKLFSGNGIVI